MRAGLTSRPAAHASAKGDVVSHHDLVLAALGDLLVGQHPRTNLLCVHHLRLRRLARRERRRRVRSLRLAADALAKRIAEQIDLVALARAVAAR